MKFFSKTDKQSSIMGLNRINKPESLARKAVKVLRKSILNNDLTVGTVYNEKSLAEDLGISRTPVREALLELSSKRLIKFLPQKGVVVNTFSCDEIDDVIEIRIALEVFSIKKICQNQSGKEINQLARFVKQQRKAAESGNKAAFIEADQNFHLVFSGLTNNAYLTEMMQDIRDIMHLMCLKTLDLSKRMDQVVNEHEMILEALIQDDADKAAQYMISHLEKTKEAVKAVY